LAFDVWDYDAKNEIARGMVETQSIRVKAVDPPVALTFP
jgi:hypothetical protein